MAGQKNYEMLFRLNAQVSSQYNSTFKSAQSAMNQFRNTYNSVAKAQNDISAYQRQQSAVESTKEKLSMLQQQYDNIQREISETGSYSSSLENRLLSKQQQIAKTSQALEAQNTKLGQYSESLQKAGVDTGNLDNESARLRRQLEELKRNYKAAGEESEDFGEEGKNAAETIEQALVAAGIVKLLKEIYEAFSACVSLAGDFEESMSNVEALSGADAQEMAQLSQAAQELGATTKFTAQEASDAMGYMAMAGWDAQQMLSGMDGVLQLAAASGEDLATVSDIVTDNLTAFGLQASDTARFSDVLAAAATKSNTSVSIMGETFKSSASIAGALGYSVEDVAIAVGLMANSGVKGSIAGTALKNTFNGLLEGATLTSTAFGDYEFSAVKADGTMKDFGSTIDELRVYFAQMTEAERVNNAITLAGERGYNGLLAILNATDEDYASLTNSINNCTGAASKMAEIKLDNMNGQLTIAKSSWDALKMSIGEQFTPALTKLYTTAAKVFGGISSFLKQYPEITKALAAITIGVTAFAATLAICRFATQTLKPKILELNAAMAANPFLTAAAAITALVTGFAALIALGDDCIDKETELTATSAEHAKEIQGLNAQYQEACDLYGATSYEAQSLQWQIEELTVAYEDSKQTLAEWEEGFGADIDAHNEIIKSYDDATGKIDTESQSINSLIAKLLELSSKANQTAADQEAISAIVGKLNEQVPDLGLAYNSATGAINLSAESLRAYAEAEIKARQYDADLEAYLGLVEEESALYNDLASTKDNATAAQKRYNAAKAAFDSYDQNYVPPDVSGELDDAYAALQYWNGEQETAQKAYDENIEKQQELSDAIGDYVEQTSQAENITGDFSDVMESVAASCEELVTAYNNAYTAAYDSITGQYQVWDEAKDVSATSVSSMDAALQSQAQYWQNYDSNISLLSTYAGEIDGLNEMIASFADGSEGSVNAVAGIANALNSGDVDAVRNMVASWQQLREQQKTTSEDLADLETDFSRGMETIKNQLTDDIRDMNMNEEAAEAGRNTINGFINSANDMIPYVRAAYASVGKTATDAIYANLAFQSFDGAPKFGPGRGYASGTASAERGFAMVGESGPEIVWFNGGEQVMTASETAAYQEAASVANRAEPVEALPVSNNSSKETIVHFSPVYEISGTSNPEEIRGILAEHDANMKEQIRDLLEEEREDAVRRSYT